MAVIHMRGRGSQADRAEAVLGGDHRVTLGFGEAVLASQVVPAVVNGTAGLAPRGFPSMPGGARLDLSTALTVLVAVWDSSARWNCSPHGLLALPVGLSRTLAAMVLQAVKIASLGREGCARLDLSTPRAALHFRLPQHFGSPFAFDSKGKGPYCPPF
ncbi:hypothetical protein ACWDZ8_04820 [Streptomyces sp. NPDC003233]